MSSPHHRRWPGGSPPGQGATSRRAAHLPVVARCRARDFRRRVFGGPVLGYGMTMTTRIASEVMIGRLADWGVDTVFGLPGDGINGLMEGLRRNADRVRFVLVHHEEAAAFMATGHAKATGRLGVCLATSGPGGIHLLNGLYDAKLDHAPVLAITGMQETAVLGTGYQQEVHLEKLFEDVAVYDQMIYNPAQLPAIVDIAVRHALARRGVAHLTFPNDLQVADADADPWRHVAPVRAPET